jgi:MoaA/NifB/PqqE/SkfB family radical SAM enzyme
VKSKRQVENSEWKKEINFGDIINQTGVDGSIPENQLYYIDLRLSPKCQLKCTICSPKYSNKWILDWKTIQEEYSEKEFVKDLKKYKDRYENENYYNWFKHNTVLRNQLFEGLKYVKKIAFLGGEPLIIKEHDEIIDYLIDNNLSQNVDIRYNSNGIALTENHLKKWSNFKSVLFSLSIDGLYKQNDYMRYGSNWEETYNTLKLLEKVPSNTFVSMGIVINAMSVYNFSDMITFFEKENFSWIKGKETFFMNILDYPEMLSINVLPKEIKERTCDKLSTILNHSFIYRERLQQIINQMNNNDWERLYPNMIDYLTTLDKMRNTDFKKYFPHLNIDKL